MKTELVRYQHGLRVCLACWYADFIPGVVPSQYVYTSGHHCPQCHKDKLTIRPIALLAQNRNVMIILLTQALTKTVLCYRKEFESIECDLTARGALKKRMRRLSVSALQR